MRCIFTTLTQVKTRHIGVKSHTLTNYKIEAFYNGGLKYIISRVKVNKIEET